MKRLIRIEWLKNYSYFPVILFSGIYFILVIGFTLLCSLKSIPILGIAVNIRDQGFLNFPQIWNFLTYITALLKLFLGLIIVFTISNEFTAKMFKQNVIDGLSKKEFVISKVLTIGLLSFISTLVVFFMGIILGLSFSDKTGISLIFKEFYFIFGYFLKLFTFLSFLFFITVLLKRVVFVFLSFFIWWIIELILLVVEYTTKVVEKYDSQGNRITEIPFLITDYLPLNVMSNLIDEPFQRIQLVNKLTGGSFEFKVPYDAVGASIVYSTLFILGSYWLIKRRDW
ncbi:MAG: ABC transporter permease [Bacteroidetes bacterium]|nr:ABC transporter permease [Bacteroidota bacterium]